MEAENIIFLLKGFLIKKKKRKKRLEEAKAKEKNEMIK
jgi:hypothetical protein